MARGQVLQIPAATAVLITTSSREEMNSVAVLNPNDGVVYLKLNGAAGPSPSQWDWKLPSQSYGLFPGPWISLGLYYIDQSGAGRNAELNVYDAENKLYVPNITAIGRAVQSAGTSMDVTQGAQPQNPPANTGRLWVDTDYNLHLLRPDGTDQFQIDNNDQLGGVLTGTLLNPGMAAGAAAANVGTLGGALSGSLPNPNLAANSVGSAQIVNGSIATADIGNQQITPALLAAGAAATNIGALQGAVSGTLPNTALNAIDSLLPSDVAITASTFFTIMFGPVMNPIGSLWRLEWKVIVSTTTDKSGIEVGLFSPGGAVLDNSVGTSMLNSTGAIGQITLTGVTNYTVLSVNDQCSIRVWSPHAGAIARVRGQNFGSGSGTYVRGLRIQG